MLGKAFFERIEKVRTYFLYLDDSTGKYNLQVLNRFLRPAEVVYVLWRLERS